MKNAPRVVETQSGNAVVLTAGNHGGVSGPDTIHIALY